MAGAGPAFVVTDAPWPRQVHVPGRGTQPDRETLEHVKAWVPARFDGVVPADHPALVYGLALNDRGFFWECHEILEAVWKAALQGGRDRILLRALIQIANANLKHMMGQPRAVARLLDEAAAELDELARRPADGGGLSVAFPATMIRQRLIAPTMPVHFAALT